MGLVEKDERTGLQFVRLNNGRRICYREEGLPAQEAKRHLLVLHGVGSSRLAGMPGVKDETLRTYGVRLIAIDRPGYGKSDADKKQTLRSTVEDLEEVADSLEMGEKIWLLGYSGGGSFCWAAARHIPHRIAGIVGWSPVGYFWWNGITAADRKAWLGGCSPNTRLLFGVGKKLPHWMKRVFTLSVRPGAHWIQNVKSNVSESDRKYFQDPKRSDAAVDDNREALSGNRAYGMYKDTALWTQDWGFEPDDVAEVYQGKFHIWQGTEDTFVPVELQRWIKNKVPGLVDLHEVPNEGHVSWFCFNDEAHHQTFEALFGESRQSAGFPPKQE